MKILVLGGTGMAGHTISIYLHEKGFDVTTFSRKKFSYCKNINGNVTNFDNLNYIIESGNFDVIINAIGILNKNAELDKSNAVLLNSYLPHYLSEITKNSNTRIIHISTDCVFLGDKGNYYENSLKDGSTFYDRTKALGELDNGKDLTFRNSIIGPDMNENGIGLFNWFMSQKGNISGYSNVIWTGITTLTLAKAIEHTLMNNLVGLYNLVNGEKINKYELLVLFNKYFEKSDVKITPTDKIKIDKSLINTRTDLMFVVPSYEIMIIEMKKWIESHIKLYPHYTI